MITQLFKTLLLKPFLISFLLSFATTYFAIRFAEYFGLMDNPKKRSHPAHTHTGNIPRAGGLAIAFAVLVSVFIFFPFSLPAINIAAAIIILTFVGVLDDKKDISPYFRLPTNILCALIVIAAGVGVSYITNPLGGVIRLDELKINFSFFGPRTIIVFRDLFSLFWIVFCMNIIGWSGGVDGQLPGFAGIAFLIIGITSFQTMIVGDFAQWTVAALSFICAGAYFGFLPWNFYPQKIMPGYSGKSLAGFLLAVLAILSQTKIGTAILVLAVPLVDGAYAIFRRLSKGELPVWGDRQHLHHRLLEIGWGRRRIALFYWLTSAILGLLSFKLSGIEKLFLILLIAVFLGGFFLWLNFFSSPNRQDPDNG